MFKFVLITTSMSMTTCRLRKVVGAHRGQERLRTWQHLVLGGLSGAVAASVTMPLDYVKTATQCGSPMRVGELLEMTLREKGPRGFFRGWVSALAGTCQCSSYPAAELRLVNVKAHAPEAYRERSRS